jgi:hypothetical protein
VLLVKRRHSVEMVVDMTDAVQFEHASILGPQNRGISDLDGVLERRW